MRPVMGVFCFQSHVHLCLIPKKRNAVSMVCAHLAARDVIGDRSERDVFLRSGLYFDNVDDYSFISRSAVK